MTEETINNAESVKDAAAPAKNEVIDFGKILRNYLRHWWLFVICLAVCVGASMFYLKKKSPVYLMTGMVMLNQQEDGGVASPGGITAMLSTFGMGGGGGDNPENEKLKLMSYANLEEVVNTLGLQKIYWQDNGFFKRRANFYKNEPFNIDLPKAVLDTIGVGTLFRLQSEGKGPVHLTVKQKDDKVVLEADITKFPYRAKTPYGTFNIDTTSYYRKGAPFNVCVLVRNTAEAVWDLQDHLGANVVSNKAEALEVGMEEACIPRGVDIVNVAINLYNDRRLQDRLDYNKETLDFIEGRLLNLYNELEASESKIEKYKKDNKIVNAEAEAEYIFTRKGQIEGSQTELATKVKIYEMVQSMLANPADKDKLIPFTGAQLGLSEGYYNLIQGYNDLIMERMQMAASAKPGSAPMVKLDTQIDALRDNILTSVSRELQGARISLAAIASEQGASNARMSEIPRMEHELVALYRDREVKNQIYAYLLQKREETQIQLSQREPVAKVIDYAHPSRDPIQPKKFIVLGAGIVFGLLIPVVYLQLFSRGGGKKRKKQGKKAAAEASAED